MMIQPSVNPIKPRTVRFANSVRSARKYLDYLLFNPPSQLIYLETQLYHYPQSKPKRNFETLWLAKACFIDQNDQPCCYSLYDLIELRFRTWYKRWQYSWKIHAHEPILHYKTPQRNLWIPQSAIRYYKKYETNPNMILYLLYLAKGQHRLVTETTVFNICPYHEVTEPLELFLQKEIYRHVEIEFFGTELLSEIGSDTYSYYAETTNRPMGQT